MVRPGQTLVEVLLALAIILVGLLSLTSALINTQLTASTAVEEGVAIQLAREGVEAVRFLRDRNWLEREDGLGTSYYDGLRSSSTPDDYTAIYTWNPQPTDPSAAISFDFTPDTSGSFTTVYQSAAGLYRQSTNSTLTNAWTPTIFSRFITLYPICSSDGGLTETFITGDGQVCPLTSLGESTEIGVQAEVTVTWSSRGTSHTRVIAERLYDWRYAQP